MNTNTKEKQVKTCTWGHEYPLEKQISLGCPICLANWLDKGLTLD